ncbi:MAG: VOC family protein [Gammaproteobacteria bacterium]|nr:VOC family protein [Gammaproteobacteria bacterium]
MKIQPMITVRDVQASSRFYQQVLDAKSGHGGNEYEQIVRDDTLLLQLHHRDAHEHPDLIDDDVPVGNGIWLYFLTDRFDDAIVRLRTSGAPILEEPHVNPLAGHRECLFLDPDGYKLVFASPHGDLGEGA